MAGELTTYYPYRQPLHPDIVRFGNLAFDYRNPKNLPRYRHKEDIADLDKHTATFLKSDVLLDHYHDGGFSFAAGLDELFQFSSGKTLKWSGFVVGKNGKQAELKEYISVPNPRPQEFFDDVVLQSEAADFWLKSRLAVANKLQLMANFAGMKPKLWMLTGLVVIEDANYFSVVSSSENFVAKASVPVGDPIGALALMQMKAGAEVSLGRGLVARASGQVQGKSIWAAQWQRVKTKFILESEWKGEGTRALTLFNIVSTFGDRDDEETLVDMEVMDEKSGPGDEDAGLSVDYLARFVQEIKDLEGEGEGEGEGE